MKTNGFFGKIAAMLAAFDGWFSGKNTGWKRNNKSMMRETSPNAQRGCSHTANYQPKGRKYAKGASGSIGLGIIARFDKSAFCQQKRITAYCI
jgi:hypothetical protein